MSIKVMSAVWESSTQSGGTLLVLLALADFADDSGYSFPAVKTLAIKARLSERQTQRALAELEKAGEITVHHCQGAKRSGRAIGFTNRYQVLLKKGCQNVTRLPERGDILGTKGVTFTTERGDAHDTQTVIEPPLRTTISTTPSYTTTEDSPKQYADETKTLDAPRERERELLERGEGGTHSQRQSVGVRTARSRTGSTQQPAQAHNTKYMSPATSRKTNTTSDCQTTPTSPVQPTNTAAEQILQAYHQTRFNKPCSDPQQVITLMAYATDLHNAGYSPAKVTKATRSAMERWSSFDHATLRAVTKHIATLLQPVETSFVRQSDQGYNTKPAYEAPIVTRDKSYKRTSECESMNLALELQDTLDALRLTATQKKYKR